MDNQSNPHVKSSAFSIGVLLTMTCYLRSLHPPRCIIRSPVSERRQCDHTCLSTALSISPEGVTRLSVQSDFRRPFQSKPWSKRQKPPLGVAPRHVHLGEAYELDLHVMKTHTASCLLAAQKVRIVSRAGRSTKRVVSTEVSVDALTRAWVTPSITKLRLQKNHQN